MNPLSLAPKRSSIGFLASVVTLVAAFVIPSVRGQNLIVDPTFSLATTDNGVPSGVSDPPWDIGWFHTGVDKYFGPPNAYIQGGSSGYIKQTVDTVPGQTYIISENIWTDGYTPNSIYCTSFGNNSMLTDISEIPVETVGVFPSGGLKTFSFTAEATDTSTDFSFYSLAYSSNFGGEIDINNVSVTAIPEPSTYAAIMGLASVGFVMLRCRFVRK